MPENRDSQARRVVGSHTHGEPILPPNFRRRVAGVPPVRREALRVGFPQFQSADVKTPGSLNFGNPEVYILFDRPPWKNKWVKAEKRVNHSQNKVDASRRG